MKSKWHIDYFDDYHEIFARNGYNSIELGCFPPKGSSCCYYFGLFYKGRKPSIKQVIQELLPLIDFGSVSHFRTGSDISVTEQCVTERVKSIFSQK